MKNPSSGPDYATLRPVTDHRNLAETVYQHLLEAISELKIRPGESLNEVRLSQRLGVSVTPVREALLRLSADGLVIREPQRQPRLVMLTPPEVEELYDVRGTLESFAAAQAARLATDAELERFDGFLQDGEWFAEHGMSEQYDTYHDEVHKAIMSLAANQLLERMMQTIWVKIRLCMSVTATLPGRRIQGAREHAEIIDLIKARNPSGAAEAMRRHCELAKTSYLQNYPRAETPGGKALPPSRHRKDPRGQEKAI